MARMRSLLLGALMLAAWPLMGGTIADDLYKTLTPGPYQVKIKGMLTRACARAIQVELAKNPLIVKPKVDFDQETATFMIRPNGKLSQTELRAMLRRASKKMRLSTYELVAVRYMPAPK